MYYCVIVPLLLATGSRDRLVHIFDVAKQYTHCGTIDDHSASITAVDFSGKLKYGKTCCIKSFIKYLYNVPFIHK